MKLLFVDHYFHQKSRSVDFLLKMMQAAFDVDLLYVDIEVDTGLNTPLPIEQYDLVLLFQLDFLAPYFLRRGIRTVVVPMYDGSANLPKLHWEVSRDARFLNFSRTLHDRILAAGAQSLCLKYFLPPCNEKDLPKFDDLRGILWMRRPQDGITPRMVGRLLGSQLKSLHVHNAPDDGKPRLLRSEPYWSDAFAITESTWSQQSSPYMEALKKCNVFFAPRAGEGIGMTMLEAFANGLLVIAHDESTHDEYVSNWINGILVHKDLSGEFALSPSHARELAICGWHGAKAGYAEWLDQATSIVRFVRETPQPERHPDADSPDFLPALWNAYLLGIGSYEAFLECHLREPDEDDEDDVPGSLTFSKLDLRGQSLHFGYHHKGVSQKRGFARQDLYTGWLESNSASFRVGMPWALPEAGARLRLDGLCEKAGRDLDLSMGVTINNHFLGTRELRLDNGTFTADFPIAEEPGDDWKIQVFVQQKDAPGAAQPSVGLTRITLEAA